jgi:hypothetical protein
MLIPFQGEAMHAVLTTVSIAPGEFEAAHKSLLSQVIPRVKQSPGFVRGVWTIKPDHENGTAVLVFQTLQDAENAANQARHSPMPTGVTLRSAEVCEVTGEA